MKTWVPAVDSLDTLLDTKADDLALKGTHEAAVRVAFQQPVKATFRTAESELLANTFEDALLYENLAVFQATDGTGLWGKLHDAANEATTVPELAAQVKAALKDGGKAQFAMDLLDSKEIDSLVIPAYINAGLKWLIQQLKLRNAGIVGGSQLATDVAAAAAGQPAAPAAAPKVAT